MAFAVRAETVIDASPERVWDVLVDAERWPEWNPFLTLEGGRLDSSGYPVLRLSLPGQAGYVFRPHMLAFDPPKRLAWIGRTGVRGVFDGAHTFTLASEGAGTRFVNEERFSGLLSPIMRRLPMMREAQSGFEEMNRALKARVEGTGP